LKRRAVSRVDDDREAEGDAITLDSPHPAVGGGSRRECCIEGEQSDGQNDD